MTRAEVVDVTLRISRSNLVDALAEVGMLPPVPGDQGAVAWRIVRVDDNDPFVMIDIEPSDDDVAAIARAMYAVEDLPADETLTEAVVLLGNARRLVNQYVGREVAAPEDADDGGGS